jgi:hypothetical protein
MPVAAESGRSWLAHSAYGPDWHCPKYGNERGASTCVAHPGAVSSSLAQGRRFFDPDPPKTSRFAPEPEQVSSLILP